MGKPLLATVAVVIHARDAGLADLADALLAPGGVAAVFLAKSGLPSVYRVDVVLEATFEQAARDALAPLAAAASLLGVTYDVVHVRLETSDESMRWTKRRTAWESTAAFLNDFPPTGRTI